MLGNLKVDKSISLYWSVLPTPNCYSDDFLCKVSLESVFYNKRQWFINGNLYENNFSCKKSSDTYLWWNNKIVEYLKFIFIIDIDF